MSRLLPRATLAERGMVLLVMALCTFLVASAAGTALWLRTSADDVASRLFAAAPYPATQLQVSYDAVVDEQVPADGGAAVEQALATPLREALRPPRAAVISPEMVPEVLPPRPGEPIYLSVAALPDSRALVDVEAGRMPRPGSGVQALPPRVAAAYDGPADSAVVEVALEASAARELEMPLGSWVALGSPSYQGVLEPPAVLHVVGTFRPADPYPTALDDVETLRRPAISETPELNLVRATALAADSETVLGAQWTDEPQVRWTFDPGGTPTADEAEVLVEEGRQVGLQDWPPVVDAAAAGAATNIGDLAEQVVAQRRTSDGLVLLALTALGAGALTVLLAASLVLADRRGPVTTVVRARGASGPWLVARRGGEALLLVAPGVVVALVAVGWASGRPPRVSEVVVALAAAATCAVVVMAAQVVPRGSAGGQLQAVLGDALQLVAVALAVAVTVLVLLDDALAPDDPLMLVLPPLLGAAAAVVVMRGLQGVLGALRRLARRTHPLGPVVALSQSVAVARTVVVASTAVVLAASAAVLAVAVSDTVHRGAERTGWEQVGADVSVATGGLDDEAVRALADLPGVESVAPVFTIGSVSLDTRTGVEGVQVVGVDPAALAAVGDGPLGDLDLARGGEELTAVASSDLALDDGRAVLRYAQSLVDVEVVERLDSIPGITRGGSFLLVDLARLEAATDRNLESYDIVLLAGDPSRDAVLAEARRADPQAVVRTRADVVRDQLDGPAVARTLASLTVATVVAATLAGFAVLLCVGLGAPERRRTALVLGRIGADPRQAARIGVVSILPIVAAAGLAAVGCGLLLTGVAGSGFDLAGLTGTLGSLTVRPDPLTGAAIAAALAGLLMLAALTARTRAPSPARTPDRPDLEQP